MLGEELHVVGAVAAAAFDVVDVRVGDEDADGAAEVDHLVEALLGGEADERDGAGDDGAGAVLHELDVEEDLVAEVLLERGELCAGVGGAEAALQIGEGGVLLHGPERGVVPGVVGEQRRGAQAGIVGGECDFAPGGLCFGFEFGELRCGDHEEDEGFVLGG